MKTRLDIDNPRVRSTIYRCVALAIIVAGCKAGVDLSKSSPSTDAAYLTKMKTLSETYALLEKNGQYALAENTKDPQMLLDSLARIQARKVEYLQQLQALVPPDKYKEFHQTLIEWRTKEGQNEQELLNGFVQYSRDHARATADKLDKLTKANEDIGRTYEAKTMAIAKAHGAESVEKFLSTPAR